MVVEPASTRSVPRSGMNSSDAGLLTGELRAGEPLQEIPLALVGVRHAGSIVVVGGVHRCAFTCPVATESPTSPDCTPLPEVVPTARPTNKGVDIAVSLEPEFAYLDVDGYCCV